jgi:hypothetical protein
MILIISGILLAISILMIIGGTICGGQNHPIIPFGIIGMILACGLGFLLLGIFYPISESIEEVEPRSVFCNEYDFIAVSPTGRTAHRDNAEWVNSFDKYDYKFEITTKFNSYGEGLKHYKLIRVKRPTPEVRHVEKEL